MRVLVTAFEPFGGDTENATQATLELLVKKWHRDDIELTRAVLPVAFHADKLNEAIGFHRPDVIIGLGEAGSRKHITPEQVAYNEIQARIPDNNGNRPDGPIDPALAPTAEAGIDADVVTSQLVKAGWAASLSSDPGRFVCNFIAFHLYTRDIPSIFIHVPALRSLGEATVGEETGGSHASLAGKLPQTFEDLAEAIAMVIDSLPTRAPSL